jgi:hypothetical protein
MRGGGVKDPKFQIGKMFSTIPSSFVVSAVVQLRNVQFRFQLSPGRSPDHKEGEKCTPAWPYMGWPFCSDFTEFIDLPGYYAC